ncbi:hypothetical protein UFOVP1346_13 [uncultured Caudovirales phage]|uniref:Uncharacterized protein n=1 Tax=uncultured Caudovirales phage TaxID=2100421 RepID=A0A6J5S3L9_9CAUD|nr:hypothetical protein UFOVP921_53 [uncultured Caudovirales phage]CAB4187504.1 hypothetical protein UFOVP1156_29 [uncultured Caudovirales phage]CAB4199914.1 hypothetical protein UFOVP1346_13 [uncultured Caudovirales phage]
MNDTLSPAKLDQILETRNRQVIIDAESCSIVKDLKEIDKTLGVRFVDGPDPYFAVFQSIEHADGRLEQHLVTTVQAHPTTFGTFTGLDQRLVERVRKVTHSSYDFMAEAEKNKKEWDESMRKAREDKLGEMGEQAAHAMRKDLGSTNKAFIK